MFLKILLFSVLLFSLKSMSQEEDTFSKIQYFKINSNVSFGFKKPRTWDMFRHVPNDIVGLGKFTIQKKKSKMGCLNR